MHVSFSSVASSQDVTLFHTCFFCAFFHRGGVRHVLSGRGSLCTDNISASRAEAVSLLHREHAELRVLLCGLVKGWSWGGPYRPHRCSVSGARVQCASRRAHGGSYQWQKLPTQTTACQNRRPRRVFMQSVASEKRPRWCFCAGKGPGLCSSEYQHRGHWSVS